MLFWHTFIKRYKLQKQKKKQQYEKNIQNNGMRYGMRSYRIMR